jgi:hypothetical protein
LDRKPLFVVKIEAHRTLQSLPSRNKHAILGYRH